MDIRHSRETVLEINLNRMSTNLKLVRSRLKANTKTMAMVKAFAYGSDSHEVAHFMQKNGVDYLAVAFTDEGVALRENGITIPIMVLNPELSSLQSLIAYRLEPQVYNFRTLENLTTALKDAAHKQQAYPIHVKINSGMNRMGFNPEEITALGRAIASNKFVKIKSVLSHLSGSDDQEMDDFSRKQYDRFISATEQLSDELGQTFMRHFLNSNGVLRHPEYQLDMIRLGIALYGISTNSETKELLQPVSSLKTRISQIRKVKKGEIIGYNPKSVEPSTLKLAILSIGYADGLPRMLGNRNGRVWINGKHADIIANVSMDMCMVDISHIDCKEGDEAEIFGNNLSIYEMAERLHTIPYEVLTNVSQRVKRVSVSS